VLNRKEKAKDERIQQLEDWMTQLEQQLAQLKERVESPDEKRAGIGGLMHTLLTWMQSSPPQGYKEDEISIEISFMKQRILDLEREVVELKAWIQELEGKLADRFRSG
jgi:peptidoglycan hydrolase CwlO-like protein